MGGFHLLGQNAGIVGLVRKPVGNKVFMWQEKCRYSVPAPSAVLLSFVMSEWGIESKVSISLHECYKYSSSRCSAWVAKEKWDV